MILQHVEFALRMLAKNPGCTIVAALTLALGIEEDSATGAACAGLVGAMASKPDFGGTAYRLSIQQGVSMGRRSEIEAEALKSGSVVTSVSVGGRESSRSGRVWIRGRVHNSNRSRLDGNSGVARDARGPNGGAAVRIGRHKKRSTHEAEVTS